MIIYKITNTINGKIYIGQTLDSNPERRIKAHFKKTRSRDLVRDAATKYGRECLSWEIIYQAFDLEELNRAEKQFIIDYNSLVPNGYNIQLGGNNKGKWSEDSKKENGLKVKEWYKYNNHPFKDKKFTQSHIENLSKTRKGFDSQSRQKARKVNYNKSKIPIKAINLQTSEEYIFESIKDCADSLNLIESCIGRVLRGKQNRTQHNGYKFILLDKQE